MYPKSLNGYTILVIMSARKKCLKRTRPKGDIKMFKRVCPRAIRPFLYMKWKGFRNMNMKMKRTPSVKAATAFSKRKFNFKMKVWHIRQKAQMAKSMVAILKSWICVILY